jgi:hypothetical protein
MSAPIKNYFVLAGATKTLTLIDSGTVPDSVSCALLSSNETLINSVAATSSGNGHYYAVVEHPGSSQWVVNEWRTTVNGHLYKLRQFGKVMALEVD